MARAPAGFRAHDTASQGAIRAVVAEQMAMWGAGDGARCARHVAPEVSFPNLLGMVIYAGPAFVERHKQILAGFYKGPTKRQSIRRIGFVTPDVAIVDIDNEIRQVTAMPAGIAVPADDVIRTHLMEVVSRRQRRW